MNYPAVDEAPRPIGSRARLLALATGLMLAAPEANAATPIFGTFANVNGALDGGFGDFSASKSLNVNGRVTSLTGAAVANLAEGTLRASSLVTQDCSNGGCGGSFGVNAIAAFRDRYVFTNTGENIALIPVTIIIDGTCAGSGGHSARWRFGFAEPGKLPNLPYRDLPCNRETNITEHVNLLVFEEDTHYDAFVEISTLATIGGRQTGFSKADFGNTLRINIVLPEGVTARSASGVFPFQRAGAVPEPETWSLMVLGFGAVGYSLRRRGYRAVQAV